MSMQKEKREQQKFMNIFTGNSQFFTTETRRSLCYLSFLRLNINPHFCFGFTAGLSRSFASVNLVNPPSKQCLIVSLKLFSSIDMCFPFSSDVDVAVVCVFFSWGVFSSKSERAMRRDSVTFIYRKIDIEILTGEAHLSTLIRI